MKTNNWQEQLLCVWKDMAFRDLSALLFPSVPALMYMSAFHLPLSPHLVSLSLCHRMFLHGKTLNACDSCGDKLISPCDQRIETKQDRNVEMLLLWLPATCDNAGAKCMIVIPVLTPNHHVFVQRTLIMIWALLRISWIQIMDCFLHWFYWTRSTIVVEPALLLILIIDHSKAEAPGLSWRKKYSWMTSNFLLGPKLLRDRLVHIITQDGISLASSLSVRNLRVIFYQDLSFIT